MTDSNQPTGIFRKISAKIYDYVKARGELLYITFIEKLSRLLSYFIATMMVFIFMILFVVFLSIFVGLYLSSLMDSFVAGFGIIALVYFIVFLILWIFKGPLISRPVTNAIIRVLSENFENKDRNNGKN